MSNILCKQNLRNLMKKIEDWGQGRRENVLEIFH